MSQDKHNDRYTKILVEVYVYVYQDIISDII